MAKTKAPQKPADTDTPVDASVERGPTTTTITFRGERFSFPTSQADWPTLALQRFQRKENVDGVELLLGQAQWERFNEAAPAAREFWEFWGVFLGVVNSPAASSNGSEPHDD